jgi:hypothetical protein
MDQLVQDVAGLMTDHSAWKALSAACRKYAETELSMESSVNALERLLDCSEME